MNASTEVSACKGVGSNPSLTCKSAGSPEAFLSLSDLPASFPQSSGEQRGCSMRHPSYNPRSRSEVLGGEGLEMVCLRPSLSAAFFP